MSRQWPEPGTDLTLLSTAAGRSGLDKPKIAQVREGDYYATIIETARILGWIVAHFRPARTGKGWRTAVQGDGKGFPDFVLVHAGAGRVWFVELKVGRNPLSPEQTRWGESLLRAGGVYRLVRCPDELQPFLQDLADAVRPT